jgi:nucleoid-associated protein YgaU
MTRETKIGLLVGLAFIIVIGILLSDHLTSSTEPPPAVLTSAAGTVRGAIASPGSATAGGNYPPVANVSAPSVTPQQTVPTASDLKPPVQIVAIGPSTTTPQTIIANSQQPVADPRVMIGPAEQASGQQPTAEATSGQSATTPPTDQQSASQPPTNAVASANAAPNGSNDQDLANIAAAHGEPLVSPDGKPLAPGRFGAPTTTARQYVAQDGDSLSKMAGRFLGANTKANRDAIVRLNPSLKTNPDMIIVGKAYRIPTPAAVPAPAPQTSPDAPAVVSAPTPAPRTTTADSTTNDHGDIWYVVKPNDSLWRIANDQLGSPSAIDAIKELNKNTLKGENHEIVYVGMRLKLPTKPLAQAN